MTHDEFWALTEDGDYRRLVFRNRLGEAIEVRGVIINTGYVNFMFDIYVRTDEGHKVPIAYDEVQSVH